MPQHVQRSMLFNFYTGFGRFRRSAWSKKWYGSGRTSRIASDAPEEAMIAWKAAKDRRMFRSHRQYHVNFAIASFSIVFEYQR